MKQLTVDVSVHWLIKHFYDSDELWYIPVLRSLVQPYTRLYRFAGPLDGVLLSIAAIAAVFCGVIMPLFSILFGNLLNAINATSQTTFTDAVNATALQSELYNTHYTHGGSLGYYKRTCLLACWLAGWLAGTRTQLLCYPRRGRNHTFEHSRLISTLISPMRAMLQCCCWALESSSRSTSQTPSRCTPPRGS